MGKCCSRALISALLLCVSTPAESATIVEDFAGGWFSKTNWERGGITRKEATGFAHVAMRKIADELKQGARPDGE